MTDWPYGENWLDLAFYFQQIFKKSLTCFTFLYKYAPFSPIQFLINKLETSRGKLYTLHEVQKYL